MPGAPTIKSFSHLGDRLLYQLSSEQIHNPVKLLCRDSSVKIVHKDVLLSTSTYFRQTLASIESDQPIAIPVSTRVLDQIIEFIYTTKAIVIEISDVIDVYAAADLFQLDEITSQLKDYFHSNLADCLQHESFLLNQNYDEVARFVTIFPLALDERDQIRLIQTMYDWAKRQAIESARVGDLVARIVAATSSLSASELFAGTTRSHTVPLLVCSNKVFEVADGRLIEQDYPQAIIDKLFNNYKLGTCITGNEAYVSIRRSVTVYDLTSCEQIRSVAVPEQWKSWFPRLAVKRGKIYTCQENEVYQLLPEGFVLLCRTTNVPTSLCVFEHNVDIFKFCYKDNKDKLYVSMFDGKGTLVSDTLVYSGIYLLVGVHDDHIIVCTNPHELVVLQGSSAVWKRSFDLPITCAVSYGANVSVQFDNDLCIVDTTKRTVSPIFRGPRGFLMLKEVVSC